MLWKIVTGKKRKKKEKPSGDFKNNWFLAIPDTSTGRISLRLGWGWGGKALDVNKVSPDA